MIRAVQDINVLISGIFWTGTPFEILKYWQARRFQLVISPPILEEYRRVLEEMTRKHTSPTISSIVELIEIHSQLVEPVSFLKPICSDPDDDKFLEAAISASASYVVSGDAALLRLKRHDAIEIVRPARFLHLLG